MSETRKVVAVTYTLDDVFIIPDGIDLENKEQVESWYVRYNLLHICLVNGEQLEIEPYFDCSEYDYKRPHTTKIANYSDYSDCL